MLEAHGRGVVTFDRAFLETIGDLQPGSPSQIYNHPRKALIVRDGRSLSISSREPSSAALCSASHSPRSARYFHRGPEV